MNEEIENYLFILPQFLGTEDKIFTFEIYIFNENNQNFTKDLDIGDEFNQEKREFYQNVLSKGSKLAIHKDQLNKLKQDCGISDEQLEELQPKKSEFEIEQEKILELNKNELEQEFYLNENMQVAMETNNFMPLITRAKKEIEIIPFYVSPTTSNAVILSKLMTEDNLVNRIVALSYLVAIGIKIKAYKDLGDLICAAYYSNIGLNYTNVKLLETAYADHSYNSKREYNKHPLYSTFLLKKSGIQLSDRCFELIELHHELPNGNGYPRGIKGPRVDILAQIIGMVENFFYYCDQITAKHNLKMEQVLNMMRNQMQRKGLVVHYNETILEYFTSAVAEKAEAG